MRRTAWIWLAGCLAWLLDAALSLRFHSPQRAQLGFLMAALFAIAYAFYRTQKR